MLCLSRTWQHEGRQPAPAYVTSKGLQSNTCKNDSQTACLVSALLGIDMTITLHLLNVHLM